MGHPPARTTASVVIPLLDDAEPLRRCLAAMARQTVPPLEVIVVDNGSSDAGPDVAREAGATVVAEPAPGIAAAAARGYDEARGDLVLRLDSDSVPDPDWIERVVAAFDRDESLGALTGPGRFLGLPRPIAAAATAAYMGIYFTGIGRLIGRAPLFGSNLAMRRTTWRSVRDEVHRHDEGMHDDLDLALHIAARSPTRLDRHLVVGMSARPLGSAFGMLTRLRRAVRTLRRHPVELATVRRGGPMRDVTPDP